MSRSGTLSRMHARGQIGRARTNRHPLRKVIGTEPFKYKGRVYLTIVEVLECGHRVRIREDWIGETTAAKRRCRQCTPAGDGGAKP